MSDISQAAREAAEWFEHLPGEMNHINAVEHACQRAYLSGRAEGSDADKAEIERLKSQLEACFNASKDMHSAQAVRIAELEAQLQSMKYAEAKHHAAIRTALDLSVGEGTILSCEKIRAERDSLAARVKELEKEQIVSDNRFAEMITELRAELSIRVDKHSKCLALVLQREKELSTIRERVGPLAAELKWVLEWLKQYNFPFTAKRIQQALADFERAEKGEKS